MKNAGLPLICFIPVFALACGGATEPPPQEAEHREESGREVRLSEEVWRAAGIKAVPVSREAFHPHVTASGVIRPDAQKSVTVRSRVPGRVARVLVDVGSRVKAGQSLAVIESSEITAALTRYRTSAAKEEALKKASERAEGLLALKALSRAEVEARQAEAEAAMAEADAARQDLTRLGIEPGSRGSDAFQVTSPLSGKVIERAISPGLLVDRDAALFSVADLTQVWAVADVYEKDLGQVQEQGEVEVRTDAYPGEVFTGRIALLEPALDEASRSAHIRVLLDNRSGRLRPGLFVIVAVPVHGASEVEATAIPAEALQKISGLPAVFVESGPGRFELRPVETGREAHGMVEIRHGLRQGEKVVTQGAFILKSELLKGTIEGED